MSEPVILIVDDNLDNLKLLSNMLGKNGYKTRRAISGSLALQALGATTFDLILLDITMPDMDGYEVCCEIKKNPQFAQIPIIFISALNDALDKVKAFEVGGTDYITKPFQIEEVTARVSNQLRITSLQAKLNTLNQQLVIQNQTLQKKQQQITKHQERIVNSSLKDPITGLNTKITFIGQIRQFLLARSNSLVDTGLILVDFQQLNLFKNILGLDCQNKCLITIGKKMNALDNSKFILGRLSDREFGIFIKDKIDIPGICKLVKQIQPHFKLSLQSESCNYFLNPNFGIAVSTREQKTPEELILEAQIALNHSLTKGKGCYQVFTSKIKEDSIQRFKLHSSFQQALTEKALSIHYYPVIDLKTDKISSLIAEFGWRMSDEKILDIGKLSDIAGETGLVSQLNQLIIETICQRLRELREAFLWQSNFEKVFASDFSIQFKINEQLLFDPAFPQQLQFVIEKNNLEGEGILLELSSLKLSSNLDLLLRQLNSLQQINIKVGLTQVSTDCLRIIQHNQLAIHHFKMPASLTKDLLMEEKARNLYQSILKMAQSQKLATIAPEISNSSELEIVKDLGCRYATGEYINKVFTERKMKLLNAVGA